MALTEGNGGMDATMLVQPSGIVGNNGGAFGNGFGADGWWIILLFILLGNGGWGGYNNGSYGGNGLYPWMNQANLTTNGFQNQLMNDNITSIRDGIQGISTQLCNGFAGIEQGANARQVATTQGMTAIQSQLAQCCCDNRMATADLKYTVATENCADRYEAAQNTRDIIDSQTRGTQAIIDKLCALELDNVKNQLAQAQRDNVGLQNQLNMATLRESQTAQNAFFAQGLSNEVDALYNRLSNCPVPTIPVYGRQPIFTCGNNGCGCGCGNF